MIPSSMRLSIKAEHLNHASLGHEKWWVIDSTGGTVGRSADCNLVLEDTSRVISRVQAHVAVEATGQLTWYQKGGNPSLHNGHPVCVGHQVTLCDGDVIELGDYCLTVKIEQMDLNPQSVQVTEGIIPTIPEGWWKQELPDAKDDQEKSGLSIDHILEGDSSQRLGVIAEFEQEESSGSVLHERFFMPSVVRSNPSSEDRPVESSTGLHQELIEGLGLPADTKLDSDQLKLLGQLMRTSIQAFVDLLAMRTVFKREMRSDVTTIIEKNNNPLKFCPNADEALRRMLSPPQTGYLDAHESIKRSVDDLLDYQRAITYALDSGFSKLVDKLDPDQIYQSEQCQGMLKLQRKANAWAEYEKRYSEVFQRGHDPFESAMGDAFREALNAGRQGSGRTEKDDYS